MELVSQVQRSKKKFNHNQRNSSFNIKINHHFILSQKEILIPSSYMTRLSHERFFKKWPLNSSIKNDCSRKSNHKIKRKTSVYLRRI